MRLFCRMKSNQLLFPKDDYS